MSAHTIRVHVHIYLETFIYRQINDMLTETCLQTSVVIQNEHVS